MHHIPCQVVDSGKEIDFLPADTAEPNDLGHNTIELCAVVQSVVPVGEADDRYVGVRRQAAFIVQICR